MSIPWSAIEDVLRANGLKMPYEDPKTPARGVVKIRQSGNFHWEVEIVRSDGTGGQVLLSEKGPYISTLTDSGVSTFSFDTKAVYEFLSAAKLQTSPEFRQQYPQQTRIPGKRDPGRPDDPGRQDAERRRQQELERQREHDRLERERREREERDREGRKK